MTSLPTRRSPVCSSQSRSIHTILHHAQAVVACDHSYCYSSVCQRSSPVHASPTIRLPNILVAITHNVDVCVVHHSPVFLQVTFRHPRFDLRQLNFVLAHMSSRDVPPFLKEAAESGPDARRFCLMQKCVNYVLRRAKTKRM